MKQTLSTYSSNNMKIIIENLVDQPWVPVIFFVNFSSMKIRTKIIVYRP